MQGPLFALRRVRQVDNNMSGLFNSTRAMLAGAIPPLLHRDERRPPHADADLHLHVQG